MCGRFGFYKKTLCFLSVLALSALSGSVLAQEKPSGSKDQALSLEGDPPPPPPIAGKKNAKSKKKKPKKDTGQDATIRTESAIVYTDPNFDAATIAYLSAGKKVKVSKRIYGKYFRFHKIRLEKKKYGYISTIDIDTGKKTKEDKEAATAEDGITPWEQPANSEDLHKPFMAERYVGLVGGMLNYKEKISGIPAQDTLPIYGLKITGPDILFFGPTLDINLAFHYGAPKYYKYVSQNKPSGYMILTDILLMFPFMESQSWAVYLAAGPMLLYSNYRITVVGSPVEVSEANFGGSFVGGFGFRLGRIGVRLEGKYILEKQHQTLFQASLQHRF